MTSVAAEVANSPLLASVATLLQALLDTTVATCSSESHLHCIAFHCIALHCIALSRAFEYLIISASESTLLAAAGSSMEESAAVIVAAVEQKNAALNISTGATVISSFQTSFIWIDVYA